MINLAVKSIIHDKKTLYFLIFSIALIILTNLIFLQISFNPYVNIEPTNFSEMLIIPILVLGIIIVSNIMISFSFNYYMKKTSKEYALIRLRGYTNFKIMMYYTLKIAVVYIISITISLIIFWIINPVFLFLVYDILECSGNIYYISKDAVYQSICIVSLILIIVIIYQFNFLNTRNIKDLFNENIIGIFRRKKVNILLPDIVYLILYLFGISILILDNQVSNGVMIPASIGSLGAFGIFSSVIPNTITKMLDNGRVNIKNYIVLSDLSSFMKQSKILVLVLIVISISIPIGMINLSGYHSYFIIYAVSLFLLNAIFSSILYCRFKINILTKSFHYKKLYALGLSIKDISNIQKKVIAFYYLILLSIVFIYILTIVVLSLYNKIDFRIVLIIILDFLIPYIISWVIIITKNIEGEIKWKK